MLFPLIAPMFMALQPASPQEVLQDAGSVDKSSHVVQVHDVSPWTEHARAAELLAMMRGVSATPAARAAAFKEYAGLMQGDSPQSEAESLARTLQFVLEPELGAGFAEFTASADGSALVAMASPSHHRIIARTLEDLSNDSRMVDVSAFVIRVSEAELSQLMGGMSTRTLSPQQLLDFEEKIDGVDAAKGVSPRIILHPMAPAEIFIGNEVAYIADYESTSIPDLFQEIADPVISTVMDGERLNVRAAPVGDLLRLRVRFESSHLVRPIPMETMRIGSGGFEVKVQRPELKSVKATATFDVGQGTAVVLGTIDETGDPESPSGVIVIVKAELIEPMEESGVVPEEPEAEPDKGGRR